MVNTRRTPHSRRKGRRFNLSPSVRLVLDFAAIATITYVAFRIIYSHELPKIAEELSNALLGAIAAALVTFLLLTRQSQSEEEKERNVKVFEKKAENFLAFIDELWTKWSDFNIDPEEVEEIREIFYKKVYVYLSADGLQAIAETFRDLEEGDYIGKALKGEERAHARRLIFQIIARLKQEMGLPGDFNEATLSDIDSVFDRVSERSEQREKEATYHTKADEKVTFWHFALFDSRVEQALQDGVLVLGDDEGAHGARTALLQQIAKNDIVFAYSRGNGYIGIFQASDSGKAIPKGSTERRFMPLDSGEEGQVPVNALVLLPNTDCVPRDAPRLKTIQRIYDPQAICTLLERFREKAQNQGRAWPTLLTEIHQTVNP